MRIHPRAGRQAEPDELTDIPALIAEYYVKKPDPKEITQRVSFGTSGHRGSSFDQSFNEWHIVSITQAICDYRKQNNIGGPLFIGMDTHALSTPAFISAMEVLAANKVETMVSKDHEFTPTPAVSHAILCWNKGRKEALADGIVITPSHNPPSEGGFKYNPPNGGPADQTVTAWIEAKANRYIEEQLKGVQRIDYQAAMKASTTHEYGYLDNYVQDLTNVIDMEAIRSSGIKLGVNPLGGAGVHYWKAIGDKYKLDLTVVNTEVDPTFRFMTLDWDGQIRMDPSSVYAMESLIAMKNKFDVAFACDTDHDRHGIVAKSTGLLQPNHFLSVCIYYLFTNRSQWRKEAAVGKTLVSSRMIDKVTERLQRRLYEVPVGFKWFVEGLLDGSLGFVGEESAGASFSRKDGTVWTTDKDGIIAALLAAEITANEKKDPGEVYRDLTKLFGDPAYARIDAPATLEQKERLKKLSPEMIHSQTFAGEKIESILTKAPGNNASIGGVKVNTANGWFAARPSGTENIYKIYAESFKGTIHLEEIMKEAQEIVNHALQPSKELK